MIAIDLTPAPGAAPLRRMVRAMTALELRLTLRRGESVLLTLVIPVVLLVFFAKVDVLAAGPDDPSRLDFLVPGVLALAVMSTSMTGLAIATAFERQHGVLKRLGATPLPRWALLASKTAAVLVVEVLQAAALLAVAAALGWRPASGVGTALGAAAMMLLGTVAFAGLGLLMAGRLRAEATLAAANGLYLVLLLVGGLVVPLVRLPAPLRAVGELLPTAALSDALRDVLAHGASPSARAVAVLAAWAVAAAAAAATSFRWE